MAMTQTQSSLIINPVSGAGIGLKGGYIEALSSLNFNAKWMWVGQGELLGFLNNHNILWDLATGLGGFEVDDYPDIYYRQTGGSTQNFSIHNWPVNIPAGSRVSVRLSDEDAIARTHHFLVTFTDAKPPIGTVISHIQVGPFTVASPILAGVDGAVVELHPSVPNKVDWIWIYWQSISATSSIQQFDIMTGGAGSETDRLGELPGLRNRVPVRHDMGNYYRGPVRIDAGERVSVRVKTDVATIQSFRMSAILFTFP